MLIPSADKKLKVPHVLSSSLQKQTVWFIFRWIYYYLSQRQELPSPPPSSVLFQNRVVLILFKQKLKVTNKKKKKKMRGKRNKVRKEELVNHSVIH